MKKANFVSAAVLALAALPVFAQTVSDQVQRNINQQKRIEDGLKSGQLSTKEAAELERGQARINEAQAEAMKDGKMTDAERARIRKMQDEQNHRIYAEKHDAEKGNPKSESSRRMQADVGRNVKQQQRIQAGIHDGSLNNREVGKLQRHQAGIARTEARAGQDGHVGAHEQRQIQQRENRTSDRIYQERHDNQTRN